MIEEGAIKAKIRAYLSRSLRGRAVGDQENIFELGLVHSLFTMQIVLFIEREFGVELYPEDLALTDLATVDRIATIVLEKQRQP